MLHRTLLLTALATTLLLVACTQSEDDACGKGDVYRDGGCHPAPVSTAGTAPVMTDGGAGNEAAGAGGAGSPSAADPNFGLVCRTTEDCQGPTDYCVPMSPFDSRYCSARDCDPSDASTCPAGWTCTDLNRFQKGEPWACTRPF